MAVFIDYKQTFFHYKTSDTCVSHYLAEEWYVYINSHHYYLPFLRIVYISSILDIHFIIPVAYTWTLFYGMDSNLSQVKFGNCLKKNPQESDMWILQFMKYMLLCV